jgi:hypothetical protein
MLVTRVVTSVRYEVLEVRDLFKPRLIEHYAKCRSTCMHMCRTMHVSHHVVHAQVHKYAQLCMCRSTSQRTYVPAGT